jgi:hypothetical protein
LASLPLKFYHPYLDRHGKVRNRFRRAGYKTVYLPGVPGSAEFMAAYQAALAGETAQRIEIGSTTRSKPGSVAAAVAAYLGSIDFGALAYATQRDRRRILENFRDEHGEKPLRDLTPWHVGQLLAGKRAHPHSARSFLKALRAMIAVAIASGLCESDPAAGIRVKVPASRGYTTWTEDDIAAFESVHPIGTKARLAFALLLFTGQRRGDVVRMGRQHVKGGFLTVRQSKTGADGSQSPFTPSYGPSWPLPRRDK